MSTITCPTCELRFEVGSTKCMPFCSFRCQQIDLGRWIDEENGMPIEGREDSPEDYV